MVPLSLVSCISRVPSILASHWVEREERYPGHPAPGTLGLDGRSEGLLVD